MEHRSTHVAEEVPALELDEITEDCSLKQLGVQFGNT
jgi:hypothetical protein